MLLYAVIVLLWILISVFTAAQFAELPAAAVGGLSFGVLVLRQLISWSIWIPIGMFTVFMGRKFPLGRAPFLHTAIHLLVCIFVIAVHLSESLALRQLALRMDSHVAVSEGQIHYIGRVYLIADVVLYWGILGMTYAVEYYRLYRERELHAAVLQNELSEARLQTLTMQLQPHFLFNALNSAVTLIRKDEKKTAIKMLVSLSDFLRYVTDTAQRDMVQVQEEMLFVKKYLEVEQIRFHDRLSLDIILENGVESALVPTLITQPLVENAVKHGIGASLQAGTIQIRTYKQGEYLCIEVHDSGRGTMVHATTQVSTDVVRKGVGLMNVQSRLQHIFGETASVEFRTDAETGTTVLLRLPFREQPTQAHL